MKHRLNGRFQREDFEERFWSKVGKAGDDDCWPWLSTRAKTGGYGLFKFFNGVQAKAHRVMWVLVHNQDPGELLVCHKCDNPPCVNPNHLFLGTTNDNVQDKVQKGRQPRGDQQGLRKHPERAPRGMRNAHAKFSDAQVIAIRNKYALGVSQGSLSKEYGVCQTAISAIVLRKTWKHLP